MPDGIRSPRANQRYRTRKDLIAAAARLMKGGRKPSLEEVAEAALVSRATAYRYFPSIDALLAEASVDVTAPDGEALFAGDPSVDPEERVAKAEAAMHRSVFENEAAFRLMLSAALVRAAAGVSNGTVPLRQNRRTPLIEAALAPARGRLTEEGYARLCAALAMIFGSEVRWSSSATSCSSTRRPPATREELGGPRPGPRQRWHNQAGATGRPARARKAGRRRPWLPPHIPRASAFP